MPVSYFCFLSLLRLLSFSFFEICLSKFLNMAMLEEVEELVIELEGLTTQDEKLNLCLLLSGKFLTEQTLT